MALNPTIMPARLTGRGGFALIIHHWFSYVASTTEPGSPAILPTKSPTGRYLRIDFYRYKNSR